MEQYFTGCLVTEDIVGANPKMPDYVLYKGVLIVQTDDGSWTKLAPGLCLVGLRLTEDQEASLKPVKYESDGLNFHVIGD